VVVSESGLWDATHRNAIQPDGGGPSYTLGMKTAVSIPDELFSRAEEMARKTGKSRSQLYQEALSEYLLRRDPAALTQAMDEALADIDQTPDPWLAEAGRRTVEHSEW
jgi:predicted transcriptional regulator